MAAGQFGTVKLYEKKPKMLALKNKHTTVVLFASGKIHLMGSKITRRHVAYKHFKKVLRNKLKLMNSPIQVQLQSLQHMIFVKRLTCTNYMITLINVTTMVRDVCLDRCVSMKQNCFQH